MVQSKGLFDRILGKDTTVLSYPVGRYNEESLRLSEEAGYKMAVTTEPGGDSRDQGIELGYHPGYQSMGLRH
ncbi:hypothetical protein [Peribacillus simplex]|uniref:hypothetical protein n=1 Tax=Peribacillus simplex TaxID=1478 RepID=UPI003D29B706